MIYNNVLEAVGQTPLIRLNRMVDEDSADILVKFEALNVGGSIKTRTALNMIIQAEKQGLIHDDTIIVEPTSGNQGIGLALVGAVRGYRTIIIMPDSVSEERRKLIRHYGAEVKLIHDAGDIGACIDECLKMALKMKEKDKRVFVPQQFENINNVLAHKKYTALEISARAAPLPASERCSRRSIPALRSGQSSRRTPRFSRAAPSERTCKWASATASSPISSTAISMTTSTSSPTTRRSAPQSGWRVRKV